MATIPDYTYTPLFGVDPYDALGVPESAQTGGGAKVSNDNLMISLWQIDSFTEGGVPIAGDLMKPSTEFGDFTAPPSSQFINLPNPGTLQQLPGSRLSSSFSFFPDKSKKVGAFPLLAILNPPSELKGLLGRGHRIGGRWTELPLRVSPSRSPSRSRGRTSSASTSRC